MAQAREVQRRRRVRRPTPNVDRHPARALGRAGGEGATVLLLGFEDLGDDSWAVLAAAGSVVRVADVAERSRACSIRRRRW